jgi:hypothetical protein
MLLKLFKYTVFCIWESRLTRSSHIGDHGFLELADLSFLILLLVGSHHTATRRTPSSTTTPWKGTRMRKSSNRNKMSSSRDDDDQYVQLQKVARNYEICLSKFRGVLYYLSVSYIIYARFLWSIWYLVCGFAYSSCSEKFKYEIKHNFAFGYNKMYIVIAGLYVALVITRRLPSSFLCHFKKEVAFKIII